MKIVRDIYLSLGTNQGNKLENLQKALNLLADSAGVISKISTVYQTKSWGYESNDFLNICVKCSSSMNPEDFLLTIREIEREVGRKAKTSETYEDRIIDIDMLLFDREIIFSNELTVPHKSMLERNFVLVPLAEIAPHVQHPITKTSIQDCLKNCSDTTEVSAIETSLERPLAISEIYNYIAIEGNIGAGKTTLTKMMANDFNAKIVLERFADNPFLPKFYEDNDRFAFPLEMSFLADRYRQLSDDLAQFDLFKNFIVSDYYIFKSLIFAQVTLQKEEYLLYRRIFDIMYKEITKPELYIYLYQNTDRLLENIKKRGRSYEQNIEATYLDKIHQGYSTFIKTEEQLNTLIIDVSDKDFVNNPEDYKEIIQLIKKGVPSNLKN